MSQFCILPHIAASLLCLALGTPISATAEMPAQHLVYVASYQGLLTAGIRLDIADVQLDFMPDGATSETHMAVSTQDYDGADALFPVRFCYQSRIDHALGTSLESNWWSRMGTKAARGRLHFDQQRHQVLRLHAERKLDDDTTAAGEQEHRPSNGSIASANHDRETETFAPGKTLMDRLGMLLWLRRQPLRPGMVLEPAVSNGRKLAGYRIEVTGHELLELGNEQYPSLKIRLQAKHRDQSDGTLTWMWLSDDARRLPLLFRGARGFGRFELRLLSANGGAPQHCHVAEAAALSLPSP
jgi:hypothetical protein